MGFLIGHESVEQVIDLMKQSGEREQIDTFVWLIECVESMELQYSRVLAELQEVRKQLEQTQEQTSVRGQGLDALQAVQKKLEQARNQLDTVKEKIIFWAKTTLKDVKRLGVTALDTAASSLKVQTTLESIADKTYDSMMNVEASVRKAERIGEELRRAGAHLKNAGRAAAGKELQRVYGDQAGRFQTAILFPLRTVHSMLVHMNRTINSAADAMDGLNKAAVRCRGKREKPSVRQRLEEKKTETQTPLALSDPARKPHEAAR